MNYAWILLAAATGLVGCAPNSKDGGSLIETDANNVQPATQGGTQTDATAGSDSDSDSDSGSGSGSGSGSPTLGSDGSTGGGPPAACVEQGWDTSLQTWQASVDAGGGHYFYVAETANYRGKGLVDCWYHTTIRVEAGTVVERSFALVDSLEGADCEDDFEEVGDEIGQSDVPYASAPVPLDQVYAECCSNHLDVPKDEFVTYFQVDEAGLLQFCGAAYDGCLDGCGLSEPGQISIVEHGFGE